MQQFSRNIGFSSMVLGLIMFSSNTVKATSFSIENVDGDWVNAAPSSVTINNSGTSGGLSSARWGTPVPGSGQSGYDFLSVTTPFSALSDGTAFSLGTFTHLNFPITGTALESIDLELSIADLGIFNISTTFNFIHDETPNTTGGITDNDLVTLSNPIVNQQFSYGGQDYFFNLFGFSQDGGTTLTTTFSTIEGQTNRASLYARITESAVNPTPEPVSMLLFGTGLASLAGFNIRRKKK